MFCSSVSLKVLIFFHHLDSLSSYSVTSGVLGTLYPLIMAALLGIGDGVLNTQLSALLGILFKHDTVTANPTLIRQIFVW